MTWSKLKWTALFSMILGHICAAVPVQTILLTYFKIEPDVSYPVVTALQCIGSIAFPIYAFGIAQGCIHTDNALFYCLRLLVFAIIAEVPYNLTLRYGFVKFAFNNILFTLLLGAVCCLLYDFIKKQIFSWAAWIPVLLLVFLAEILNVEGGGFAVICIIIPYVLYRRHNKTASVISLGILIVIYYAFIKQFTGSLDAPFQWLNPRYDTSSFFLECACALIGILLLISYNEKKGKAYCQWFHYIAYPAHLLLLYILNTCIIKI